MKSLLRRLIYYEHRMRMFLMDCLGLGTIACHEHLSIESYSTP
jgi:hypothetical protein